MSRTHVQAAIDDCYEVFAKFPRPAKLDASPYEDAQAILADLSFLPLRELTSRQLFPYAGRALTTIGDDRDYRHFLPRILELSAGEGRPLVDPSALAGKLNYARWGAWPLDERDAVLGFFERAFETALVCHPDECREANDWFAALVILGASPESTFGRWRSIGELNAALNLAAFVVDEAKHILSHQEVRGGYWQEVDAAIRREVIRCLISEESEDFLLLNTENATENDHLRWVNPALGYMGNR